MKAALAKEADESVGNGSIIHWSEESAGIVPVTCGCCQRARPLKVKSVNKLRQLGTFTGYHNHCRVLKHNKSLGKAGVKQHPSGAVIYWDWEDRDPEDPTHRISIICSNKDRCITPGERVYINRTIVETYPNWSGRCSACVARDGLPMRRCDQGEDVVLPSGSIVHWSERTTKRVTVTCAYDLGDHICGYKREVTIYTVRSAHHRNPTAYTGYCKKHYWDEVRALQARRVNGLQHSGPVTTSPNGKSRRGRRAGVKYIDPLASRAALESAIKKLWSQTQSYDAITYAAVAGIFQSAGERIGADAVRKRFNECGISLKWRNFVVSVVGRNGN